MGMGAGLSVAIDMSAPDLGLIGAEFNVPDQFAYNGESEARGKMFGRRSGKSSAQAVADRLHGWAVRQSREPALYASMGVPDTVEGRFELLTLHIILLLERLRAVGPDDAPTAGALQQTLFDIFLSRLDGAMREMGVGDLAMGKRMRKLGEVFYGRARAYESAFAASPSRDELLDLVKRTLLADSPHADVSALADHILRCRDRLSVIPTVDILGGDATDRAAAPLIHAP